MKLVSKLLLFVMLLPLTAMAENGKTEYTGETDSLQVSLLTCAPGHQIHRLYGHTALRIEQAAKRGEDWAYNFGWFSFQTPNFIAKFVLGLTDYSMCKESTALFLSGHIRDDMPITQQVLNLTPQQKLAVQKAMQSILNEKGFEHEEFMVQGVNEENDTLHLFTPHWIYRYNFLYDNCTTRAIKAIVEAIEASGEKVVYPTLQHSQQVTTQREMIHEFTRQSPWYEFGQDLLLGPEVDRKLTIQDLITYNFLPTYAQNFFEQAKIKSTDGRLRPLVAHSEPLLPFTPQPKTPAIPITPIMAFGSVLGIAILLTFGEYRSRKDNQKARRAWRIWTGTFDSLVLIGMGIVGCMLTLMVGWSEHPAVDKNWLLTIFHPLLLLYLPCYWYCRLKNKRDCIVGLIGVGVIAYFIIKFAGLQYFPIAADALACTLLIRAGAAFYRTPKHTVLTAQ